MNAIEFLKEVYPQNTGNRHISYCTCVSRLIFFCSRCVFYEIILLVSNSKCVDRAVYCQPYCTAALGQCRTSTSI